jgi:hypothetical protein
VSGSERVGALLLAGIFWGNVVFLLLAWVQPMWAAWIALAVNAVFAVLFSVMVVKSGLGE